MGHDQDRRHGTFDTGQGRGHGTAQPEGRSADQDDLAGEIRLHLVVQGIDEGETREHRFALLTLVEEGLHLQVGIGADVQVLKPYPFAEGHLDVFDA